MCTVVDAAGCGALMPKRRMTKRPLLSKINLTGILLALIGLNELAAQSPIPIPPKLMPWISLVSGVALFIFRTYFTKEMTVVDRIAQGRSSGR
jgi:hypothetical protein